VQITQHGSRFLSIGIAALGAATLAFGQTANLPTKVAIINIQQAIVSTKDGEKARDDLNARFAPKYQNLESQQKEITALRDQFNKGVNTMSTEARSKLSQDIDDKTRDYNRSAEDLQAEVQQEQGKLVNVIGQQMLKIIDEVAKVQGYAMVLDVSAEQSPVIWAANGIDITRDIVAKYDAKYSPSAAATPATDPAKPAAAPAKPAAAAAKPAAPAK
jgi:outer membrane protein